MRRGSAVRLRRGVGRWVPPLAASLGAALLAGPVVSRSAAAVSAAAPPSGAERVSFESRNPEQKSPVPAVLIRPQGAGPFPAAVLVHPCGGVTPTMYRDWAPWFQARGYLVLVPDSLAPWHQTSVCFAGGPRPTAIHPTFRDAALDAYGALRYLRSRQDAIPNRIAIIGWSFGGTAVLDVTSTRFVDRLAKGQYGGFQAGIAVYPGCAPFSPNGPATEGIGTPLLMLLGGADDWVPPDAAGTIKVGAATVHIAFNAAATADAHAQVGKFLDEHLK